MLFHHPQSLYAHSSIKLLIALTFVPSEHHITIHHTSP